jgi:hypothetical protein
LRTRNTALSRRRFKCIAFQAKMFLFRSPEEVELLRLWSLDGSPTTAVANATLGNLSR